MSVDCFQNYDQNLSVVDALGKPPSGFLNGNTVLMGSYDTCTSMIKSAGYGSNYKPCKIKAVMTVVLSLP